MTDSWEEMYQRRRSRREWQAKSETGRGWRRQHRDDMPNQGLFWKEGHRCEGYPLFGSCHGCQHDIPNKLSYLLFRIFVGFRSRLSWAPLLLQLFLYHYKRVSHLLFLSPLSLSSFPIFRPSFSLFSTTYHHLHFRRPHNSQPPPPTPLWSTFL